jgi:rubrerythrin
MVNFFKANEITRTAVEIERKGRAFYLRLEENARTSETRELFRHLAVEEGRHEKIFQTLLDDLGDIELPAWATTGEYAEYIQGLIESHALFSDETVQKRMATMEDEKEAINMAIGFEKDTLLFFMEMEAFVPDREKAIVRECIKEEQVHIARLQRMYAAV